jgi:hypothetical protein
MAAHWTHSTAPLRQFGWKKAETSHLRRLKEAAVIERIRKATRNNQNRCQGFKNQITFKINSICSLLGTFSRGRVKANNLITHHIM